MSDAQMVQLRQHLDVIHDHFKQLYDPAADAPFAIKIESKITKRRHPLRQPPRTRSPRSTLQNPNQNSPANRGNLISAKPGAIQTAAQPNQQVPRQSLDVCDDGRSFGR